MKRIILSALMAIALLFSPDFAYSALKSGDTCKSLGQTTISNGISYTCIKVGSKMVWGKGVAVDTYDAAFAKAFLAEAQVEASRILANAKSIATQMSNPPHCSTSSSRVSSSIGGDPSTGLKALVFENSGICDLVVRASASFLCPDGKTLKTSNSIIGTGTFPLKASEKLLVSYNIQRYFPQTLTDCRLLTGYSTNTVIIDTYHQLPSVMILSAIYGGVFNQVEATKKANEYLLSEKKRADKVIADAKIPALILKAWKVAQEAKKAAAAELSAQAKIEADRIAQDAGLGKKCIPGSSCPIGSTGPGGGIVFYDAGSQQSWGRYLEVAPKDWFGIKTVAYDGTDEPQETWCYDKHGLQGSIEDNPNNLVIPGTEIGAGKANSEAMLTSCNSKTSAATIVRAYRGGGLIDWYLPSKGELNELCKYAHHQNTGNPSVRCTDAGNLRSNFYPAWYWSSSQFNDSYASMQYFGNGNQLATPKDYFQVCRPIRAF